MSKQQRVKLAHAEAENKNLREEKAEDAKTIATLEWLLEGARKREVNVAIQNGVYETRAHRLEAEIASLVKRADDVREAWRFELRRADAAELAAAEAKADAAAARLAAAEAQQDADTATELAQKSLAHAASLAADVLELQGALEAAVGSGVDREFRP